jgi:hypothetical protein
MDKSGLRNEVKVSELIEKGSTAINTKNEFGVHIFSSSIDDDGIIFGKLTKPHYNTEELLKAVDTNIIELIPIDPPPLDDTVPRPLYEAALEEIERRGVIIEQLNDLIYDLEARIIEFEILVESLRVELDNKDILLAVAQNQVTQAFSKVQSTIVELQNSIQKATSEAIQRVSLSIRNQTLIREVGLLQDQLFGRSAKIAEGFRVSKDFAAKVVNRPDLIAGDLTFRARAKYSLLATWINGPEIELYNFSLNPITLTFKEEGISKGYTDRTLEIQSSITLQSNETKIIKLVAREAGIDKLQPRTAGGIGQDRQYKGSFIIQSSNGNVIAIPYWVQKQRGASFKNPADGPRSGVDEP